MLSTRAETTRRCPHPAFRVWIDQKTSRVWPRCNVKINLVGGVSIGVSHADFDCPHVGNRVVRHLRGDESGVPVGGLEIASIEEHDRAGLKMNALDCDR